MVKDSTLFLTFSNIVRQLLEPASPELLKKVHAMLLTKIYNARSNEFLQGVSKLSCIKNNKAVDVNVGLRDKLKCYAADKQTIDE